MAGMAQHLFKNYTSFTTALHNSFLYYKILSKNIYLLKINKLINLIFLKYKFYFFYFYKIYIIIILSIYYIIYILFKIY